MDKTKITINDTFLVFLIPIIGYYSGYCIEYGYCSVFEIPYSLIVLDANTLSNIVIVIISFTMIILGMDYFLSLILGLVVKTTDSIPYKQEQYNKFFWMLISLVFIFFMCNINYEFKWLIYFYIFIFCLNLLMVLLSYKRKSKSINVETQKTEQEKSGILENIFGRKIIKYLWYLILLTIVAINIGQYIAKDQSIFYSVNENIEYLGIRIYGNRVITAKIDSQTRKLSKEIVVLEIINNTSIKQCSRKELNIK